MSIFSLSCCCFLMLASLCLCPPVYCGHRLGQQTSMRVFRFVHKAWWTGSWRDLHQGPSALYSWLPDSWKLILLRLVPVPQTQHCIQPDQCINAINLASSLKAKDGEREWEMPIKSCHQHYHTISGNADTALRMERETDYHYYFFHAIHELSVKKKKVSATFKII